MYIFDLKMHLKNSAISFIHIEYMYGVYKLPVSNTESVISHIHKWFKKYENRNKT